MVDTTDCSSSNGPFSAADSSATAGGFSGPSGGSTGSVAFTLTNTDASARTITAFELIEAGTAAQLSFDGPPSVNGAAGKDEVYINATGGPTESEGIAEDARRGTQFTVGDGVSHALDQSVTIDADEPAQVSLYQFSKNGSPYTFQDGDTVSIALTLQDGTQTTLTITI
jgi:hypothetical protein